MKKLNPRLKAVLQEPAEPRPLAPGQEQPAGDGWPGAAVEPLNASQQVETFESAITLFHSGQFGPAQELFRKAARGPSRDVAHAALLHARMCQRRLEATPPDLQTAEDHYNFAVALINERRMEAAEQHLRLALAQAPNSDHLYYVLALCCGLGGDLAGAYAHMRRAIELRPQNRVTARNDPDFAEIGQLPPLAELLYPERRNSG